MSIEIPIITGIIAAALHVISGPDHLAAVSPIAIETKHKVWRIGFYWGAGHLFGMLVIGLLFISLKEAIPVNSISNYSEQLVAIVLIGIGLWSLYKLFYRESIHKKSKRITSEVLFNQKQDQQHRKVNNGVTFSFSIGLLHGFAGIAHFLLLLPVLGFSSKVDSGLYIIGFAIGTVLAMTLYSMILGVLTKLVSNNKLLLNVIRTTGSVFALLIGFYWLYLSA
ncbi:MAG: sulfite exporter TauE/SafE family protein [Flavobacteriaceae bacterium]